MKDKFAPRPQNVMFNKPGGTAGKGSITTRISLPKPWVDEMGVTEKDRATLISFVNNKIIIEKLKE